MNVPILLDIIEEFEISHLVRMLSELDTDDITYVLEICEEKLSKRGKEIDNGLYKRRFELWSKMLASTGPNPVGLPWAPQPSERYALRGYMFSLDAATSERSA